MHACFNTRTISPQSVPCTRTSAAVRSYGKTSNEFAVNSGVHQGYVLVPTLFNLCFNVAIHMAVEDSQLHGRGVREAYLQDTKLVGNRRKLHPETVISDLEYADDITLVDESWDDLKAMLDAASVRCRDVGLTISCRETRTLAVLPPSDSYQRPESIHLSPDDIPA